VTLNGSFWDLPTQTNTHTTIPAILHKLKATGRIDHLRAGWKPDRDVTLHAFAWQSDISKWIEAASYSLGTQPDPALNAEAETIVQLRNST
jgi:uncharacterized protein